MKCPICGWSSGSSFQASFALVGKCSNPACGHLYALKASGQSGIHEHGEDNPLFYATRNRCLIRTLLADGVVKRNSRVLDVGSGLGHIVSELRSQAPTIEIVCVEAAPRSVAHLRRSGFSVIEEIEALEAQPEASFDTVFMVEVIEHLEDPVRMLAACRRLLGDRGVLFLTTPSGELRSGSRRTAAYNTREHLQFFTEQSLRLACQMAGFSTVQLVGLRSYHAGSSFWLLKLLKDSARSLRNLMQGRHHFIAFIR